MTHYVGNLPIKKQFGQHFLRQQSVITAIIENVVLTEQSSVFEIGCGDGILTHAILQNPVARLWVFEIDPDWAEYVRNAINDPRLTMFQENFLDIDFSVFEPHQPWTLLANLPYQITFPILYLLQKHRDILQEGVIMVQEEVAQKLLKKSGRGYGFASLFFNHYFKWKMLTKVPPQAFFPPPKVFSRLLHFEPIQNPVAIPQEEKFWQFIKICFHQPRRTLKNNLKQMQRAVSIIPENVLMLRAQQMDFDQLLHLWNLMQQAA